MMNPIIAPSVLACDFGNLQSEIEMINESAADWIHVDVMDGRFVPNISFGIPVCKAIQKHAKKPIDVHLMIEKPENFVQIFKDCGANSISVHYEACPHLHRNIQQIKGLDCDAGVAINPHTPVEVLEPVIEDIDLVCLMSVNPGYGGQQFIQHSFQKIKTLRNLIDKTNSTAKIEVDGGVNLELARPLMEAGADVLVAGNFVFGAEDPQHTIQQLKDVT